MKQPNQRGEADVRQMQVDVDRATEAARAAGTLMVMHPGTGRTMPAADFEADVKARHEARFPAFGFWTRPLVSQEVQVHLEVVPEQLEEPVQPADPEAA